MASATYSDDQKKMLSRRDALAALALLGTAAVATAPARAADRSAQQTTLMHFDLHDLPSYRAEQQVSGVLRVIGTPFRGAIEAWQRGFATHHPGVRFKNDLPSSDIAMAGLTLGLSGLAPC